MFLLKQVKYFLADKNTCVLYVSFLIKFILLYYYYYYYCYYYYYYYYYHYFYYYYYYCHHYCNLRRVTCKLQPATCNLQPAPATCKLHPPFQRWVRIKHAMIVDRGEWLGSLANIKGANKDVKISVGRSMTMQNFLFCT